MPNWWGGGSFGPRLLSEVMLCSVILLIPVVQELSLQDGWVLQLIATGFVLTGALSVAIHLRGAVAQPATMWLQYPVNLDDAPYRLWNWHDPQFLRGMGYSTGREQNNPYTLGAVLDFRKGGNALNFEGERWDSPEPGGSRTVGGHSVLVLQLAAAPTSDLVLSIEANVLPRHNAAAFGLSTDTRKIGLSLHTLRINAAPR
jgi:hypothetical protein